MDLYRDLRREFFDLYGKYPIVRIFICMLFVSIIWYFVEWFNGIEDYNQMTLLKVVVCLVLAIVIEQLIPWGKQDSSNEVPLSNSAKSVDILIKQNRNLLLTIEKQDALLDVCIADIKERDLFILDILDNQKNLYENIIGDCNDEELLIKLD